VRGEKACTVASMLSRMVMVSPVMYVPEALGVVTETIGIGAMSKLAERILVCIQEPPGPEPDPIPRAAT